MLWYIFIWALALLGVADAQRHGSARRRPASQHRRHAHHAQRNSPLDSPKTVYDPTRTHALVPRSSSVDPSTYMIVMQPITFSRKRALDMYYLSIDGGVPKATTDPNQASNFLIPDGVLNKDLQWIPTSAEAAAYGVLAGSPLKLHADVAQGVSGFYNLRFTTPNGGATSLSSFFSPPPFARGFSPVLDSGSAHPHAFLWTMGPDGTISLAQDASTMKSMNLNYQAMVAQAVTKNEMPSTADALAALQEQLVVPGKIYVLSPNNTVSGYISVSADDDLVVGPEGATFFAPGLTTGQMSHTLTTQLNGMQARVFQADTSLPGSVNATQLGVTTENTSNPVKFVIPTTGSGIMKVFGYGIGNWEMYTSNGKVYTCGASSDCYARYNAQPMYHRRAATLFANGIPTTLLPIVPIGTNTSDPSHLDPITRGNLTFSQNGTTDAELKHLFAVVEANYTYPTVVLPEISAVSDVDCATGGLLIKFNNSAAYNYAVNAWTPYNNGTGFVLVTDTLACSTADVGQHGYWLVNSMTFNNQSMTIYVDADEIGVSDAFNNIQVIWGTYIPVEAKPTPNVSINGTSLLGPNTANSTVNMYTQYSSLTCVNPPASYLGLPAAACGPSFDMLLDAKLGKIDVTDVSAMNTFSPGMGDRLALAMKIKAAMPARRSYTALQARRIAKRGWSWGNVWNAVKNVATAVWDGAKELARQAQALAERLAREARELAERIAAEARRIAEEAARAAAAAALALKRAAEEALKLKITMKTPTANIPIAVTPGGYFAEAFGSDKSLVIWETSVEKAFGEKDGKTSGNTKESGTKSESKVTAEIGLYCVDCGVTGNAHLQGILEYTLLPPMVRTIGFDLGGNLLAQVNLGLIAEIGYSYTIEKELFTAAIPGAGIKIGNFLIVGVAVTVSTEAEFEISAQGQVVAGMAAHWDDFNVHVNLINPWDNNQRGFSPRFEHKFEAAGEISAKLGLGLPIELGVGVNIPPLQFKKQIGIVNTPKVEAELKFTSQGGKDDQCGEAGGLGWEVKALDEIKLDILGQEIELATLAEVELAGGCIAALPGGPPEISVPTKEQPSATPSPAPPPPPPPPVYPNSTCPGFESTGPVPWAVFDKVDIDGRVLSLTTQPNRAFCNDQCESDPRCIISTYRAETFQCFTVDLFWGYKKGDFAASFRGQTCDQRAADLPTSIWPVRVSNRARGFITNLLGKPNPERNCCTQYRT